MHDFRVLSARLLSGKFSDRAVAVKMAGGDNSFVTIVFMVGWCFLNGIILLSSPWETVVAFGFVILGITFLVWVSICGVAPVNWIVWDGDVVGCAGIICVCVDKNSVVEGSAIWLLPAVTSLVDVAVVEVAAAVVSNSDVAGSNVVAVDVAAAVVVTVSIAPADNVADFVVVADVDAALSDVDVCADVADSNVVANVDVAAAIVGDVAVGVAADSDVADVAAAAVGNVDVCAAVVADNVIADFDVAAAAVDVEVCNDISVVAGGDVVDVGVVAAAAVVVADVDIFGVAAAGGGAVVADFDVAADVSAVEVSVFVAGVSDVNVAAASAADVFSHGPSEHCRDDRLKCPCMQVWCSEFRLCKHT